MILCCLMKNKLKKKVDDYLYIVIGDEENQNKTYDKKNYVRNFNIDNFKPDRNNEIIFTKN